MTRVPADQRRQDYIEATIRVIGERGVSGATTRRIAEAAQAPLATLHYCFHTKEQLFFAVFEYASDRLVERISEAKESSDLGKAATYLLVTTMDWFVENDAYTHAQFDLYSWALRQEKKHPGLAMRAYGLFIDRFAEILRKDMRPDDDAELVQPLARIVTSILDGLALQWHGHRDRAQLDADIALACESVDLLVESRRRQRKSA
ncbi:TetR/AcrR family transcriptional regulator [Actinacidiphila oryziradicis]|uniref:TetR/AcrR family transcriptional regulator n=1 Tax=Actinacidiphila oryziradicis TaxID=2571141 RepID=A0A4V5MYK4_9ACTN|nr:TetR/AcrR family transcriptional regulator [Actinacidiphila oryziradicis]TKA04629.1 TetR/AcrR family transcriptional regulator [Actinacidiphila oryziradicis]